MEFLLLGADHVQITTAIMQYGLRIIDDLTEGLTLYLREKALSGVADLKGLGVGNVTALEKLERESVLLPRFDRSRCVGCGRCVLVCPARAVSSFGRRRSAESLKGGFS